SLTTYTDARVVVQPSLAIGDFQAGTIGGTVLNDTTGNGFSADDQPFGSPTITVSLLRGSSVVATTTTNAAGSYTFTGVGPGQYTVRQTVAAGWVQTAQTGATITINSGSRSTGNNFADFQLATISGRVVIDVTGNGFSADDQSLTSPPIAVSLLQGSVVVASTTTDGSGS